MQPLSFQAGSKTTIRACVLHCHNEQDAKDSGSDSELLRCLGNDHMNL